MLSYTKQMRQYFACYSNSGLLLEFCFVVIHNLFYHQSFWIKILYVVYIFSEFHLNLTSKACVKSQVATEENI
jgi:hypothetical protein